jgi:RND family efflux transporter MFP subunit
MGAVQVVSALVTQADVSVRLTANGTVSALQAVDVRPQISATVKTVHIREGQFVRKGDRLFTLDARSEDANLSKAEAQVTKDRADLANAERNLERLRGLLSQEYISQSEFDTAQNQVDVFRGQLAVDLATVEASRVARSFNEITAPITGRTGVISVYPGSLVQPSGVALVSITQIDPINVSFSLPERELAGLQQALAKGAVPVSAKLDMAGQEDIKGNLVFVDNAVDTASGTIRLKAEYSNADHRLWPGMFVTVMLTPHPDRRAHGSGAGGADRAGKEISLRDRGTARWLAARQCALDPGRDRRGRGDRVGHARRRGRRAESQAGQRGGRTRGTKPAVQANESKNCN